MITIGRETRFWLYQDGNRASSSAIFLILTFETNKMKASIIIAPVPDEL
jgi:hypothetical protein